MFCKTGYHSSDKQFLYLFFLLLLVAHIVVVLCYKMIGGITYTNISFTAFSSARGYVILHVHLLFPILNFLLVSSQLQTFMVWNVILRKFFLSMGMSNISCWKYSIASKGYVILELSQNIAPERLGSTFFSKWLCLSTFSMLLVKSISYFKFRMDCSKCTAILENDIWF